MLEPMIPPPTMVILLMVRLLGSIQQPSDGKPSSLADCRRRGRPLVRLCQSHSKPEAARYNDLQRRQNGALPPTSRDRARRQALPIRDGRVSKDRKSVV